MPRTTAEILAHADELADRFENGFEPIETTDVEALEGLGRAVVEAANAQRNVELWVRRAREQNHSWASIGTVPGTSGEAARQRYAPSQESA
ncbi:hypothetical protein AAFP30_05910 [Gordonia sp. CPCC 205515]|uniref:hypothetical protein n=1 Tax=Gordonia sp. CPCC 205515 TaxID=3140791 RepID=UPI003AF3505B